MNKKLLAIAVGAAVAMPSLALAEGPTVYGKMNVSVSSFEGDLKNFDTTTDSQVQVDTHASRLGVKGGYDLDVAGLKAIYTAEYEIDVDDGATPFKQRNIFAGFEGGFGQFIVGNFDTPLKNAQGKVDEFNDLNGDLANIMSGETRIGNLIQYATPKLGDAFQATIAVRPGEGADTNANGKPNTGLADSIYASATYNASGIYGAVAMAKNENGKTLIVDQDFLGTDVPVDIVRLVGGFKSDAFEVGALVQKAEQVENDPIAGEKLKEQSYLLSAGFNIDRAKLKAQYGKTDLDSKDPDADKISYTLSAVGVDYKLAKASKVYAYYSKVEGDYSSLPPLESYSDTTISIGMEHKF